MRERDNRVHRTRTVYKGPSFIRKEVLNADSCSVFVDTGKERPAFEKVRKASTKSSYRIPAGSARDAPRQLRPARPARRPRLPRQLLAQQEGAMGGRGRSWRSCGKDAGEMRHRMANHSFHCIPSKVNGMTRIRSGLI